MQDPIALLVNYEGQEKDQYQTYFGAIKAAFIVNEAFTLKAIASTYQTFEQEYFDIYAAYSLGEVDTNIGGDSYGDISYSRAVGSQLNHARNKIQSFQTSKI